MSSIISSIFGCCFWPFLLGALLGWLLNRLLCKCCCSSKPAQNIAHHSPAATPTPPPAAKVADMPATTVATPAIKPTPVTKPKAVAKPKAKPKAASINLVAAKAAGFTIKNADDLTVIEGIGPKINDLFKDAGLKTFAQVAKATVPQMRTILDKGGSRFRIANPSTWAQQAALANSNKWADLKTLQDALSAGLKK